MVPVSRISGPGPYSPFNKGSGEHRILFLSFLGLLAVGIIVSVAIASFRRPHRNVSAVAEQPESAQQDRRKTPLWNRPAERPQLTFEPAMASVQPQTTPSSPNRESNEDFTRRLEHELEASGPATGTWTSNAWQVLSDWQNKTNGTVTFTDFHCFGRGCSAKASYTDSGAFYKSNSTLEKETSWPGPRFHSGPFSTPAGGVEAVWILYKTSPAEAP